MSLSSGSNIGHMLPYVPALNVATATTMHTQYALLLMAHTAVVKSRDQQTRRV